MTQGSYGQFCPIAMAAEVTAIWMGYESVRAALSGGRLGLSPLAKIEREAG